MSRKDYIKAANLISQESQIVYRKLLARYFITFFEQDNEQFDKQRFWNTCGLNDYLLES